MKQNNKGFTLIEILAAVVLIGILSGVAITGVNRYLEKTRQQAYEAIEETLYGAAQNYIIDRGVLVSTSGLTLQSADLISKGYIKKLEDPGKNDGSQCTGYVKVTRTAKTGSALDEYKYEVHVQCAAYVNTKTYNS